jgi:carboxyl-terminal processing protease
MAEASNAENSMTSKTRLTVLLVSTPIIVFVLLGGVLNRVVADQDSTYQPLRVFEEVVSLVMNNYVEKVDNERIMRGALQGLAEGLDADSAWLTPAQVGVVSRGQSPAKGSVGLELTRQYYLRVIAARDGSPAARAGLATGDYIRAINGAPTRELSVWAGGQALRGAPGSKVTLTVLRGNAAEPHEVTLVREEAPAATVTSRLVRPGVGLLRVAAFTDRTAGELRQQAIALRKQGAWHLVIDVRRTAEGAPPLGFAAARLFVATGTLGARAGRTVPKQVTAATSGDGIITLPITLLADNGTSQAAEVFAAALKGNKRATIVGERTLGRAASQELVKLPDGSGLWLSTARFLTPDGTSIHEKGLTPDTAVAEPDLEFGATAGASDPILDKALELVPVAPAA